MQVIDLRGQNKAPNAFGNLMQIPNAKVCNWLWDLPMKRLERLGIDGSIVARLKALYVAAGGTISSRSADFFLSTNRVPFILPTDHVFPLDTSNGLSSGASGLIDIELASDILSDVTQLQIAILFWEQQL